MIFRHSRHGVFQLGPDALATMRVYEQHAPDALEAGGLLLGRYLRGGYDLVVDRVTEPGPGDVRSRFGFDRSSRMHGDLVVEAWRQSGGACQFLGDWHTHAEPDPTPSRTDLDNWNRTLEVDVRDNQACFFVIVGTMEIRVWEGNRRTGRIVPVEQLA